MCKSEKHGQPPALARSAQVSLASPVRQTAVDAVAGTAAAAEAPKEIAMPRMIIRNANVTIVVRNAVEVLSRVTALAESKGGYVSDTKQWKENEQVRATAILRVPSAQLSAVLAAIRGLAVRVESENISSQDVSQEYVDLGAQLRNLQATEVELRELLKTIRLRTQKASEVMEIYREITSVRGDIERIQGRLQYLSQMTSLSTVTVEMVPDALAAPMVQPGWQPVAEAKAAARSLISALKALATAAIWFVLYVVPIAVIFIVVALIVRALVLRLRRAR